MPDLGIYTLEANGLEYRVQLSPEAAKRYGAKPVKPGPEDKPEPTRAAPKRPAASKG